MSSVIYNPTCSVESSNNVGPTTHSRRNSVSTFSTQLFLAKALQERGTDIEVNQNDSWSWSGLSTPNNSPVRTPFGSQFTSYRPLDLIQKGAQIIRQTFTGRSDETDVCPVPRISRRELEALSKMNLMDKLETLGLDNVTQKQSSVSPGALQAALNNLAQSNCDGDAVSSCDPDGTRSIGVRASLDQLFPQAGILTRNSSAPSELGIVEANEDKAKDADKEKEKCPFGLVSQRSHDSNNGLNMIAHIDSQSYAGGQEVRVKLEVLGSNSPIRDVKK